MTSGRRSSGWRALACALACALSFAPSLFLAQQATNASNAGVAWTRVTYLSGQSVYIETGTKDGLREGDRLTVVRAGEPIAEITVEFVSSTRASCRIGSSSVQVVIGDSVRFVPARVEARVAESESRTSAKGTARAASASSLRGRFGLRYLVLDPGVGGALTQPAFDVRLDGQHLGDSPLGLAVDIRAQRSMSSSASLSAAGANVTRVYQAALVWNPLGAATRLTVGRQFATALSSVGLFDGASLDFDRARWSAGAFGGFEPDFATLGLSNATREYGAYAQLHNVPGMAPLWSLALGGVGSYANGQIDREFGVVRATYNDRRLSIYAAQEVDINRGWKGVTEHASTTPTSSFVTVLLSLSDAFNVSGGFDNRRNVRLYRDYLNPEIAFDDSFRQGEWAGASLYLFGHLRMSGDVRSSTGGAAGTSRPVTGSLSLVRLTPLQLGMHLRSTTFTGTLSEGRLQSASLEANPFGLVRIEFSAGTRVSSRPLDATPATHLTWTGIDADVGIGRSVYLMLSTYRETGALDHSVQSFASLSYRF